MLPQHSPYPHCPECGQRVDPKTAATYGNSSYIIHRIITQRGLIPPLEGVYCTADHLLDAIKRGHPRYP